MGKIMGKKDLEKQFCIMFSMIIKGLPDFQVGLSDDLVFFTFAAMKIKTTVSELFQKLKNQASDGYMQRVNDDE